MPPLTHPLAGWTEAFRNRILDYAVPDFTAARAIAAPFRDYEDIAQEFQRMGRLPPANRVVIGPSHCKQLANMCIFIADMYRFNLVPQLYDMVQHAAGNYNPFYPVFTTVRGDIAATNHRQRYAARDRVVARDDIGQFPRLDRPETL